jgi:Uma2 family endonuclease
VAEVSDTTLRFDRTTKATLYARAGIREYWMLDLAGRSLYVHRNPGADAYAEIVQYGPGEEVAPLARPESSVRVADLFPPEE